MAFFLFKFCGSKQRLCFRLLIYLRIFEKLLESAQILLKFIFMTILRRILWFMFVNLAD